MRRHFVASTLIASSLLFTFSVRAQEGAQDEVTLKNGGVVRGMVVSSEPGTSVKILEVGQKEVRVIPWAQVSDVERGKYAPKAAAQPGPAGAGYGAPPQAPPTPEPKLGAPGVVRLHVDSPLPAQVIEHVNTATGVVGGYAVVMMQTRPVCSSPCGTVVDATRGQMFALTGEFTAPGGFKLDGYTGDVTVRLKPGSARLNNGGWLTILLGGLAIIPGAAVLPIGLSGDRTKPALVGAGIGCLAGGAAALTAGIVMVAVSGSKIAIDRGAPGRVGKVTPRYWMGEF